jgi:hypothetical protein
VTLAVLRDRVRSLSGWLEKLPDTGAFYPPFSGATERRYVATGCGLSEGPARFFAACLAGELGLRARFSPVSAFVTPDGSPAGDTLIVFSHALSPNARLPLAQASRYRDVLVVTGVRPDGYGDPAARALSDAMKAGARVLELPAVEEEGMLLRVISPTLATVAAARLVDGIGRETGRAPMFPDGNEMAAIYRDRPATVALDRDGAIPDLALVTCAGHPDVCHGIRWKLLEGLRVPDPPVWDVLQIVHGPFQQTFDRPFTFVALTCGDDAHEAELFRRLSVMLVPERHVLVTVRATIRGPAAYFEHEAEIHRAMVEALERTASDPSRWPGKDRDGPLYDVDRPVVPRSGRARSGDDGV